MPSLNSIHRYLGSHEPQLRTPLENGVRKVIYHSIARSCEFCQGFKIEFDLQNQDLFSTGKDHVYRVNQERPWCCISLGHQCVLPFVA